MFKLPFGSLPGHWGLAGKTREIAQAEYELTGHGLEIRILEIKADELEPNEVSRRQLEIDKKYGVINEKAYHRALVGLITDPTQHALAKAELDFREGVITDTEYAKTVATVKDEPWVNVVNMDFTKKSALEGSFELDWNEAFIKKLESEGYSAPTPDALVNSWFMELCRNIAMEEFDGTGDFTADSAANIETLKRWNSETLPKGRSARG
jgi:hypothetical protein